MSEAVERKVQEVIKAVLGQGPHQYIDTEAALDAVIDVAGGLGTIGSDTDSPENVLDEIRSAMEEAAGDLSSIRHRLEEVARKLGRGRS